MKKLVIDTATGNLQIALWDQVLVWSEVYPKGRGEILGTWLPEQLEKHQVNLLEIESVLVGIGPGSFTGLRTGIAFAQGLCANGRQLYTVSTLGLLASHQDLSGESIVAMRARPGLWYLGHYQHRGDSIQLIQEWMGDLTDLPEVQNYIVDQFFLDDSIIAGTDERIFQWDKDNWMSRSWNPSSWFEENHLHHLETTGVRPNYIQAPSAEVVLQKKNTASGNS